MRNNEVVAHGFDCILLCHHLYPILPFLPVHCSFPHLYFSFSTTSLCPSSLIFPAVYSSAFFFFPSFCLLFLPCYSFSLPLPLRFSWFSQEWGRSAGSPRAWSLGRHACGQTPFQQHLQTQLPGFNSVLKLHHPYLHGLSDSCFLENCLNKFAYEMIKPQLIGLNDYRNSYYLFTQIDWQNVHNAQFL